MSIQKPSIPKGTRDFTPVEMVRRNYILDTIRGVFRVFGYVPIETPAMENISTLLGKYGEEGDKLLFRILNSGDFLEATREPGSVIRDKSPEQLTYKDLAPFIAEKGLRYDLTVPFARFVVQHQNELVFPFKRYQVQPVWRADRPQKGRYREFFQCDVDVIGSNSLLYESELVLIIDDICSKLNIPVTVLINNRKILAGVAEVIGHPEKLTDITVAVDKLEKAGIEKVNEELLARGISKAGVEQLRQYIGLEGKIKEKFAFLEEFLKSSETGMAGLAEARTVLMTLKETGLKAKFEFEPKLARGLEYYTGTIIEVRANSVQIGSICGGGRYDNLTGIFGLPGMSGVGISFGADRIYDVMNELNLFPANILSTTSVLFVNFGSAEEKYCMPVLGRIRSEGISAEIYPEPVKLKKQIEYATRKNIPYIVLAGKDEMDKSVFNLKDLSSGEQNQITVDELLIFLKNKQ